MTNKNEGYNFDDYTKDGLTKPRDIAWSKDWAKFEKIGDKYQGYVVDVFYRAAQGQYDEQRGFTLKQADGELINVGIKRLPFILTKTDELHLGDPLTIELVELKPSATKGFSPTKILAFYGKNLPENADKPTVLALEKEDIAKGGSADPAGEVIPEKSMLDKFVDDLPVIDANK